MTPTGLPIETPSLRLRHFAPADVPVLFALSQEATSRAWLPSQVYRDEAHAAEALAFLVGQYESPADPRRGPYVLALELRAGGELVGHVGLSPFEGGVEIGFAVGERHQGRGLATEAVAAASRWASTRFGLERIVGVTDAANTASQRTLARAGYAPAGERRINFQGTELEVRLFEWTAVGGGPADA